MATHEAKRGSIVHVELVTADPDATEAFLSSAFGWSFERDEALDYVSWRAPDPPFGGLVDAEQPPFDAPPTLLYLAVDDVEAAGEAIVEAGGELLLEAMEIPGVGALTAFREPGGVVEAVWEDRGDGSGDAPPFTDEPAAGSVTHVELYAEDPDATRRFHETVFGWTFEDLDEGAYTLARPPTPPAGGLMPATDELPVGALLYLLVEDAAATVEAVEGAGGTVLREPFAVEGWGTMTVCEAPGGVVLATWEPTEAADEGVGGSEPAPAA